MTLVTLATNPTDVPQDDIYSLSVGRGLIIGTGCMVSVNGEVI